MRKFLLLVCIAFVVVCYAYPCLILPISEYKYSEKVAGDTIETTYKFHFNGKVDIKVGKTSSEYHYKLSSGDIIISEDDKFDKNDARINIKNIYTISVPGLLGVNVETATNQVALWSTIGIGVLAIVLVVTIPSSKK